MRIKQVAMEKKDYSSSESEDFVVMGNEIVPYEDPEAAESPATEPSVPSQSTEQASVSTEPQSQTEPQDSEPQPEPQIISQTEPEAIEPQPEPQSEPSPSKLPTTPKPSVKTISKEPTPSVVYVRRSDRNKASFKTIDRKSVV